MSRTEPNIYDHMISRHIFYAMICVLLFVAASPAAASESWGDLTGQIVVQGNVPEPSPEQVGRHQDRSVCLVDGKIPPDDAIVVGDLGGLRDVFVILTPSDRTQSVPVHPSYDQPREQKLTLDNYQCRFVPHALAIRTGQPLVLKNSDEVGHNCKITSFNNGHNVNLPAGGEFEIQLESADRIPANVSCEIHPWMDAVILAKDHPYVAITAADGSFELKNIPTGKWRFQFWHQTGGYLRKLDAPQYKVDRRGQIVVNITASETVNLGVMKLPAAALRR
jgi:hypothetical protein